VSGISTYYLFESKEKLSNTARALYDNQGYYDAYNSAIQVDNSPHLQLYHKSKLVQGVEMIPFASLMEPLKKLTIELGGTIGSLGSQLAPETFRSLDGNKKIAPVICYESIYGEYVVEYIRKGAGLIFIMTNDGWWKDTPGYQQHLAYARLRAIETRRSIARSANTGISAFINQKGEIIKQTNWWEPAVLSGQLNTNEQLTFYVTYGDYLGRLGSFLGIGILLYALVTFRKRKKI
jgi:apolipoprotein N-acyltransferase